MPEAEYEQASPGTQNLSLPTSKRCHRASGPSLADGHHLYSDERGACLPLRGNGLEKSLCDQLERLVFDGRPLVQIGSTGSSASWNS